MSTFTDKAKQVIATVAPLLGTAIGGPLGTVAGSLLASALGVTPGDDKAAEAALLTASPETLLKMKQAELDFQAKMKELGISEEKLTYDDINSARVREETVKDSTPSVLAYLITLGFFGTLAYLLIEGKPTLGGDVMLVMVGSLGTAWASVMAYYFGSSSGSIRKDKTIADIAKQP